MKTLILSAIAATAFAASALASTGPAPRISYDGNGNIQVSSGATTYTGGTYHPAFTQPQSQWPVQQPFDADMNGH